MQKWKSGKMQDSYVIQPINKQKKRNETNEFTQGENKKGAMYKMFDMMILIINSDCTYKQTIPL